MPHRNYAEIAAASYYELGHLVGEQFGDFLGHTLETERQASTWRARCSRAQALLAPATKHFPHLTEELKGYSEGAGVPFEELWAVSVEDELDGGDVNKCTTIVTNNGQSIAHTEDWDSNARDTLSVLKKTVGELTVLELFYANTLGGNAISINSHGIVHAVNTLSHTDHQVGVPRNVVARWLSETKSPDADIRNLQNIRRSAGYHHTMLGTDGRLWSLECSARRMQPSRPDCPFVHTNHFVTDLCAVEDDDGSCGTYQRYDRATARAQHPMTRVQLQTLLSDNLSGASVNIFSDMTIGRAIIDLENLEAHFWLLREQESGWLRYPIDFLSK